jgi:predicted neuraminidase
MLRLSAVLLLLALTARADDKIQAEFIFEEAPFASCHAATLVALSSGDLLAAWFGGSREGAPDVAIWGARKSGGAWSTPFELAREPHIATYNPVLFFSRDGTLWLYYKFGPHPDEWTGARRTSHDEGRTWSPVEHLPAGLYGPIKNKPLALADGTIVSGVSAESYLSWACWVERSTDNGRTWTKHGPITVPPAFDIESASTPPPSGLGAEAEDRPHGIIQPTVVPLSDGRLRMFVRSTPSIGRICYADSRDRGMTWTDARPTLLPNPNSGIDSVRLQDGRILIVYNHSTHERTPLNVAVSSDDGDTWKPLATLESARGEYSYPVVIQTADGNVHILYTWNRRKIKHVTLAAKLYP